MGMALTLAIGLLLSLLLSKGSAVPLLQGKLMLTCLAYAYV